MLRITVLGAGNGGKTMAADLSLKGHQVTVFNRTPKNIESLAKEGGVRLTGLLGDRFVPVHRFETDLAEACKGAQVIFVTVPSFGHEYYARALSEVLKEDQFVILACHSTLGSLYFGSVLKERGVRSSAVAELNALPYVCRTQPGGEVAVFGESKALRGAAFPRSQNHVLENLLAQTYPKTQIVPNILYIGLTNINVVIHPAAMVLSIGHIQRTSGDFYLYRDTTPGIAAVIEQVDKERLAIMEAVGVPPVPFIRYFHEIGYTTQAALDNNSVLDALVQSEANRYIKAPDNLDHRFMHEDVGYGLVPMSALGRLVGVKTPATDALITLASLANRKDYANEGLSYERLGFDKMDSERLMETL